jgi:hypothetical protein
MHSITFCHLIQTKHIVPLPDNRAMRQQASESVCGVVWKIATYLLCSVIWRWCLLHFHVDIHEQNDRFVLYNSYSAWLRAERSRDRIPVEARFYVHVQRDPGTYPAYFTLHRVFPGSKSAGSRCWPLTPLSSRSRMSRAIAISLLPSWAFGACCWANFTFRSLFVLTNGMICREISVNYC